MLVKMAFRKRHRNVKIRSLRNLDPAPERFPMTDAASNQTDTLSTLIKDEFLRVAFFFFATDANITTDLRSVLDSFQKNRGPFSAI